MIEIIFDRSLGLPCTSISINENLIASQLRRNIEDQIAATHLVSYFNFSNFRRFCFIKLFVFDNLIIHHK